MRIRTIIIEDEKKSLTVLSGLVKQFASDLELCGTAGHVDEAVELIGAKLPDLVFLDIKIADGTGFDVLKKLSLRNFVLIIVTAYDNYALEAIRFSAIDYLLKPVGIPEFEEAVSRAKNIISLKQKQNSIDMLLYNISQENIQNRKISLATVSGYELVYIRDIVWCQSEGAYTMFYLVNKVKITSCRNLGFYEELLDGNGFCRIHHSGIINIRFVKSYTKGKGGYVVMTDGTELEISHRRKTGFLHKLGV
jgi:two-component system, LytTR family, response regulator